MLYDDIIEKFNNSQNKACFFSLSFRCFMGDFLTFSLCYFVTEEFLPLPWLALKWPHLHVLSLGRMWWQLNWFPGWFPPNVNWLSQFLVVSHAKCSFVSQSTISPASNMTIWSPTGLHEKEAKRDVFRSWSVTVSVLHTIKSLIPLLPRVELLNSLQKKVCWSSSFLQDQSFWRI